MAEHLDTPAVKGVGYVLQFFFFSLVSLPWWGCMVSAAWELSSILS